MQLCSAGEEKSEKEVACSFNNSKVCSNRPLKRPLLDNIRRGTQGTYWESEAEGEKEQADMSLVGK